MKQQEYLQELKYGLTGRLPEIEINDILQEYQGFFADGLAEGLTEDEISEGLGSPARLVYTLTEESGNSREKPYTQSSIDSTVTEFINKKVSPPLATLGQRIGAVVIDRIFIVLILVLIIGINSMILNKTQNSNKSSVITTSSSYTSNIKESYNTTAVPTSFSPTAAPDATSTKTSSSVLPLLLWLAIFIFPTELLGIILFILFSYPALRLGITGSALSGNFSGILLTCIVLIISIFISFYKPLMEILWNGRTIGKRILGIRIASEDGGHAGIGKILLREFIGDGLLASLTSGVTTIVSIFTVAIGRPHKSVPDYIASTIVIADCSKKRAKD